ncbi:sulfurtransferase [Bacillus horti]|uniref:Thiosulfate/3-mercaptopyruvate sulfurtransferase n=1 Tax=Caldalkalibacillus horti TaxID=77523 RepID=A0ABT9W0S2_9BACI|nr:sulfurtransferase [Bacillus horti]MDQ0166833.1 thiosulfate/3-mercaptopyruvate sulfurtransferase [Bacillus horti]
MFKNIVTRDWLLEHLEDEAVVVADCRFDLGNAQLGQEQYDQDHIKGAVYFHLNSDLSGPKSEHGGRHPLPDVEALSKTFGEKGIDQSKTVVAYDAQGGAMAARLWFLLKYLGHEKVYVLDQGYGKWKDNGYPISTGTGTEAKTPEKKTFVPNVQQHLLYGMEDVKKRLNDIGVTIIDSRSPDRYRGENETIDPVGGHIPGAESAFWMDSLEQGRWKAKEQQEERLLQYLQSDKELVVYCGSGVTACANLIAFDEVGLKPKLYLGSWSDWISYKDNPIATGDAEID